MNEALLKNELRKVKREILIHGSNVIVKRSVLDDYKESTGQEENVTTVRGLFHITKGYVNNTNGDSGKVRTKGQPMLLLLYDDSKQIKNDDFVIINNKKYKVTHISNIQEFNIVSDLSLELILDGNN